MSKVSKILSFMTTLLLFFTVAGPLTAHAASPATNLTIHKITGNTEAVETYPELNGQSAPSGNPVPGISFTYWKVTEDQFNTMKANAGSYETAAQVSAVAGAAMGTTGKTAADGTVNVSGLAEGYYWFIENPSTGVKDSAAVPFGLDLPVTNEAGNGYITDLHVYPKNTLEDVPTIDKDVTKDGNKTDTFNIGQSFNWIIQPTTPKGIDEYTTYTVTDVLDSALDFGGASNITVTAGGTTLTAGTDYNATYDAGTRTVKVDFTTVGLGKIPADSQLNINVPTTINNTAVMGKNIPNNATLTYNTGHGVTGTTDVPAIDRPEVHTGSKNFVKTNGAGTNLQGAQFVIKNSDGQYLTQSSDLTATWGTNQADATVFTSDASGAFEVKGLAYGTYQIEEIKAPAGYTIPTQPTTDFTVSATSYYTDATAVSSGDAATATPQEVVNKKSYIPNTGGIGTVLFTVVGLLLMALAVVFYRRNRA